MSRSKVLVVIPLLAVVVFFIGNNAQAQAKGAKPSAETACEPPCAEGTACSEGQCVSLCNPACGAGEVCTAAGECVASEPPDATTSPAPMRRLSPRDLPPSAQEATLGAWIGLIGGGVYLVMGASSPFWVDRPTASLFMRSLSGGLFLTTGLVSQGLAGMNRKHPEVRGSIGLRITGWVGYGITALASLVTLGLPTGTDGANDPAQQWVLGTTLLGTATLTAFALDAFITASEARGVAATYVPAPVAILPSLGVARDAGRELVPTVGLVGEF